MSIRSLLREWLLGPTREIRKPSANEALESYMAVLHMLECDTTNTSTLLDALIHRDRVAFALQKETVSPKAVRGLMETDNRLREITSRIPDAEWPAWRQALNPPLDHWWWRLDETHDLPWVLLAGTLMAITLGLAVQIIQRVWAGGPDLPAVISTTLVLALTGSPLTKKGRELASWFMDKARLPPYLRGETMVGAAILTFTAMLLLRLALPGVAITSNSRGYALLQAGDLTGAQRAFQRAVTMNPDYAEAYYNLADAFVEVGDDNQALSLYTRALAADRTLDLAYNGLGYLFILQGRPERAIPVLYTGLSLAQDNTARTALWTNLGRAYLQAERYYEAEDALAQALGLNPEETSAHCALALTAEALDHPDHDVILHWERCLGFAVRDTPREQELAAMARAHLRALEEER